MKRISIILAMALLVTGFFGFTAMNHDGGCAFAPGGGDCPQMAVAMIARHMDAYSQFFSTARAADLLALLIAAAFLPAAFGRASRALQASPPRSAYRLVRERRVISGRNPSVIRWLSLFENSPSVEQIFA